MPAHQMFSQVDDLDDHAELAVGGETGDLGADAFAFCRR
jgi:hypothetical protein